MKFVHKVVVLLCCWLPSLAVAESVSQNALKVGIIAALSGDAASFGQALQNGMQLAYSKLSKEEQDSLQLLFEDDMLDSKRTISAFNKLTAIDKVDVVVTISSGTSNAVAPLAERRRIPLIAVASDKKVVEGRTQVVNFWVTPATEAAVAVPEALRRGYKKIARISSQHDGTIAIRNAFDRALEKKIEIELDEEYPLEVKEFRTYITKLRALKDIDAVMMLLLPGQCSAFAKQLRQAGITIPLFSIELFEDLNEIRAAKGALKGGWYVNTDDPSQTFVEEYKTSHPDASMFGAANGHDIVLLLAAAAKRSRDPARVNAFLHELKDFRGSLGTYSASGDNRFTLPATVKVVTDDGFKKLQVTSNDE